MLEVDRAEAVWSGLAEVGVDMDDVAAQLEREGVSSFQKSFDELLDALTTKARELTSLIQGSHRHDRWRTRTVRTRCGRGGASARSTPAARCDRCAFRPGHRPRSCREADPPDSRRDAGW